MHEDVRSALAELFLFNDKRNKEMKVAGKAASIKDCRNSIGATWPRWLTCLV